MQGKSIDEYLNAISPEQFAEDIAAFILLNQPSNDLPTKPLPKRL